MSSETLQKTGSMPGVNGDVNRVDAGPLLEALRAIRRGNFITRMPMNQTGVAGEVAEAFNDVAELLEESTHVIEKVSHEVGLEGRTTVRAILPGAPGGWANRIEAINQLISNLMGPTMEVLRVLSAMARGDISQRFDLEPGGRKLDGDFLKLGHQVNSMVDQWDSFTSEAIRLAHEVGVEGKLGKQMEVKDLSGVWKELGEKINSLAAHLTYQVRNIIDISEAFPRGDLSKDPNENVQGEALRLQNLVKHNLAMFRKFGSEVTRVAREVGTEGKLGEQAQDSGLGGFWKDITDSVNTMAANLTNQVRAISNVAIAVTRGDMSRSIEVEAQGEVNELKTNINRMIETLRETTKRNLEQDWLKTNLAEFTGKMQGQRDLTAVAKLILSQLCVLVQAQHGAFYNAEFEEKSQVLKLIASYAYRERKDLSNTFRLGEGLIGQCALEKERILITNVPFDYIHINSGLGENKPFNIVVLPILFEGAVKGVIELASFTSFTNIHLSFLDQLTEGIGIVQHTIQAGMRTEQLLMQSQSQSEELQSQQLELKETNLRLEDQAQILKKSQETLQVQQKELQISNEELGRKAVELGREKAQVEAKNREIEQNRLILAERAEQLTIASKYKSEFLANMSHELRTPLNSLLILAKLLADNPEKNLTEKQVTFASTIGQSGMDLLNLINEVLDMAKVEAGKMSVEIGEVRLDELQEYVSGTFQPVAKDKGLEFNIKLAPNLPGTISTDSKRLQQVLRNLLSNAFKFTEKGSVELQVEPADSGWSFDHDRLNAASQVISFAVVDTGVGIAADKMKIIFEPFMQGDGSTSRTHTGTGLGLSISREVVKVLGGEIKVRSTLGKGSVFTLYLPIRFPGELKPIGDDAFQSTGKVQPRAPGLPEPQPAFHSRITAIPVAREEPLTRKAPEPSVLVQPYKPLMQAASALAPAATLAQPNGKTSLPQASAPAGAPAPSTPPGMLAIPEFGGIAKSERVLLIIEGDTKFASILVDLARNRGFKSHVAPSGAVALEMIRDLKPDAITLDIQLPDMLGWTLLDQIKHTPASRHIPVHIISEDNQTELGLKLGALSHLVKPVTKGALESTLKNIRTLLDRPSKELLVVEDDEVERMALCELIGCSDVRITAVGTGREAVALLKNKNFDGLLLDLGLGDMSGFDLIRMIKSNSAISELPIIVFTGRVLTQDEKEFLSQSTKAVVIKGVDTIDRLLNETSLFLHQDESALPPEKQAMIRKVCESNPEFKGRHVLLVDDDKRNLFAVGAILEPQNLTVHKVESGREALKALETIPNIDLILMDIMMPDMNGYETTRAIRSNPRFKNLPIIALTAKAMKVDRDKCIEAGCSDYVSKPVLPEQLLSAVRVWLPR